MIKKNIKKEFIKESEIKKLDTQIKNNNLGTILNKIKIKYYKATPEEQKEMLEFFNHIPKEFSEKNDSVRRTNNEWKEIFIQFNNEIGIENLKHNTIWNGINLGYKIFDLKHSYQRASKKKKEKMLEFWDCLPNIMFNYKNTNIQWKKIFIQFINKEGFDNFISTIWKYPHLGKKFNIIINNYNNHPINRKDLREFWNCFPDEFWKKLDLKIEDKKYKERFTQYINKNLFISNNDELRIKAKRIKSLYKKATPEEQKEMREFWNCFPDEFWGIINKIENKIENRWKELFIEFIEKNGVKNLNLNTKYNNKNLGSKLSRIKTNYNKATPEEQKKMREFWDCFPEKIWYKEIQERITDKEWKELFIEFIKENGIENLNWNTKYKNKHLGNTLGTLRAKYKKASPEEQKEMREFWDCFPDEFLGNKIKYNKNVFKETKVIRELKNIFTYNVYESKTKKDSEWKELFIQFDKEVGIENLNTATIWNNKKLGAKTYSIKNKYKESSPELQKEMREFWDCFPEYIWDKNNKPDKKWRELFAQYAFKKGIENLNISTIWKNENLGAKYSIIKTTYNSSTLEEQKEMREFWDCFPDEFWGINKIIETNTDWKELFIDYLNKNEFDTITIQTMWNEYWLGAKLNTIRNNYLKASSSIQIKMREFWDCFPDEFWGKPIYEIKKNKDEKWKELFVDFINKNGFSNLTIQTKWENENLAVKSNKIKIIYNISTPEEQKEMREFWNCFPDEFWEKKK